MNSALSRRTSVSGSTTIKRKNSNGSSQNEAVIRTTAETRRSRNTAISCEKVTLHHSERFNGRGKEIAPKHFVGQKYL